MSYSIENTPKNLRQQAADKAERLFSEEKFSVPSGESFADFTCEQLIERIADNYLAARYNVPALATMPAKRNEMIEQATGVEDTLSKFMRLKETLNDIRDPAKLVDVQALKGGMLAIHGLKWLIMDQADISKFSIDPNIAQFCELQSKILNLKGKLNPEDIISAEELQSQCSSDYYDHKKFHSALCKLEDRVGQIMNILSIASPIKGEAGRAKGE